MGSSGTWGERVCLRMRSATAVFLMLGTCYATVTFAIGDLDFLNEENLILQDQLDHMAKIDPNGKFHDYPGKLKATWRKPRGQDNTCRRRLRGANLLVKIGYGSNKKTRHVLPNGFKKLLVRNAQDLELLMMNNRKFC